MKQAHAPSAADKVELRPITPADVAQVAVFLHRELNDRLPAATWAAAMRPSWTVDAPNHGFMLICEGNVVGAQVAFYSLRPAGGSIERFCNIAAWCVLPQYRSHGFRLLRAILAQPGYTFTDLSPSGSVVPLNRRLNFRTLDTDTRLVFNLPWPAERGVRVLSGHKAVEEALTARDLAIYRDHAGAPAARHLVVVKGNRRCYVIFRRDRRKGLRLFASILHVSDPRLFRETAQHVFSHLLTRFALPASLVERRVAGFAPAGSIRLPATRVKMYRSTNLEAEQIDYLYSELVSVPW